MRELTALREGWDAIEEEETRLVRQMSIQESVRQWLRLQQAFDDQLTDCGDVRSGSMDSAS